MSFYIAGTSSIPANAIRVTKYRSFPIFWQFEYYVEKRVRIFDLMEDGGPYWTWDYERCATKAEYDEFVALNVQYIVKDNEKPQTAK